MRLYYFECVNEKATGKSNAMHIVYENMHHFHHRQLQRGFSLLAHLLFSCTPLDNPSGLREKIIILPVLRSTRFIPIFLKIIFYPNNELSFASLPPFHPFSSPSLPSEKQNENESENEKKKEAFPAFAFCSFVSYVPSFPSPKAPLKL